jgi:hypothetical protein
MNFRVCDPFRPILTRGTEVVDKYHLVYKSSWSPLQGSVHSPHKGRPNLILKYYNDTHVGKIRQVVFAAATAIEANGLAVNWLL